MVGVVIKRDLPTRGGAGPPPPACRRAARNLALGEAIATRLGVLQQRRRRAGARGQLQDIQYATGSPRRAGQDRQLDTMALADAIQEVQVSVDGSLLRPARGRSPALADALTGKTPAGYL